ncbi:solute carrier family 49 member 4 homolog [Tubulanus polymorphus]|uniref:solute carrier family 49 member 4 homolog n=1 Tax=Tubulanus polymorphus TaxID=672921 RepID=UPI003DA4E1BB
MEEAEDTVSGLKRIPVQSRFLQRRSSAPVLDVGRTDRAPLLKRQLSDASSITNVTAETLGLKPYKRRFYVLFLMGWFLGLLGAMWSTWAAIAHSTSVVFGISDGEVAFLANWGPIGFITFIVPFTYALEQRGLRFVCVLATGLLAVGGAVRLLILVVDPSYRRWFIHTGQFLVGSTASLTQLAPPIFSSIWFPPNQRTTATVVSAVSNTLGAGLQAIIGPFIVADQPNITTNTSNWSNETDTVMKNEFNDIVEQLIIHAAIAGMLFLTIVAYFPARPPTPPSISASMNKTTAKEGFKQLLSHKDYWIFLVATRIPLGAYLGWYTMLEINLKPLGFTQNEVGTMMLVNVVVGNLVGIIMARLTDLVKGHMKTKISVLSSLGTVIVLLFTLQSTKIMPYNHVTIFVSVTLIGMCYISLAPLSLEVTCELAYPVTEGIALLCPLIAMNVITLIYLFLPVLVPSTGTEWTLWIFFGTCVISPISLIPFKMRYYRQRLDSMSPDLMDNAPTNPRMSSDNETNNSRSVSFYDE